MKTENLIKALEEYRTLKEQINHLNELARKIAGGRSKVELVLNVEGGEDVNKKVNVFDRDGFIKEEFQGGVDFGGEVTKAQSLGEYMHHIILGGSKPLKKQDSATSTKETLEDVEALQVIAILLEVRQRRFKEISNAIAALKLKLD